MPLLLSILEVILLRLKVAACLFLLSSVGFAGELGQKLYLESDEYKADLPYFPTAKPDGQYVYKLFSEALNRVAPPIPVEAIGTADYKRLVVELNKLASEFDKSGMKLSSEDDRKKMKARLDMLVSRVKMLANTTKIKSCTGLSIDPGSAAHSGGDWEKAKKADGSSIQPSSYDHLALFWFFRFGCGGETDFVTARKVLFDISDLEPTDPSKRSGLRSDVRHCQAEIWARYGIGGPASEELAKKFSRRFTMSAWFFNNGDGPAEREKMAKQYPAAAANDFKCPVGHESNRIDPRDPWKNLW